MVLIGLLSPFWLPLGLQRARQTATTRRHRLLLRRRFDGGDGSDVGEDVVGGDDDDAGRGGEGGATKVRATGRIRDVFVPEIQR